MTPDAIKQRWYQQALDEFCLLNGKQTEELFLSVSVDLLWPLFALLDDLTEKLTGAELELVIEQRAVILQITENRMGEACKRIRSLSPSHTRLQAMVERLRVKPEAA